MLLILLFILCHVISLFAAELCHPEDRAALTAFKHSFSNNPDPFPTWKPISNCCDWRGVTCDEATSHVVALDLTHYKHLNGTIPSSVSNLKHLMLLRLYRIPHLVGQIPQSITQLPLLRYLTISWTNISGPVPHFLNHLVFLDLSFNRLSGSIPPSLATLPLIGTIDLSRNQLTGPIPELFMTRSTTDFETLDLSDNNLSGQLPASFSKINFSFVDISRNGLSGDASVLFGKGATSIVISWNDFEFDFSKVAFPESLFVLDVSHNRIYGTIPQQITEAYYLQSLNVSYNRLCGKVPSGWKLRYNKYGWDNSSFFHNKCLCGVPLDPCK
ncbi:hypothetical protein ACS0TY_019897 [Phlomoides rotata]